MSHEVLVTNDGFAHFAANDAVPVWHRLGQRWEGQKLPSEALELARADYPIYKARFTATVDLPDGTTVQVPSGKQEYMLVRGPMDGDDRYVAWEQVSAHYEPVQNRTFAGILDPLAKHLPLDVFGVLRRGKIVFATLKAEPLRILVNGQEDAMDMYLLVIDYKTEGGIKFLLSPVQTVCMNTVVMAEGAARLSLDLGHRRGVTDAMKWTAETLGAIASQQRAVQQAMQMIADRKISDAEARDVFNAAFPMPGKPARLQLAESEMSKFPSELIERDRHNWDRSCERMAAYFRAAMSTYFEDRTNPGTLGTAWGAYSAVTAVCDHQQVTSVSRATPQMRAESALVGERYGMKLRAWNAATLLAVN